MSERRKGEWRSASKRSGGRKRPDAAPADDAQAGHGAEAALPERPASEAAGTTIGRYRLIRRLGTGSFATVWLGHDDDLDVAVAVKVLLATWASDDDVRQRFVTEARLMRRIRDVRITHVYDIGQLADGRPYFVMDFADGGSLNEVRRGHPTPVRALRLCAETCRAIGVLHEYDVVHRDVTPGNVLLTRNPASGTRVMIADLGVANDRAAAIGLPMTAGTPGYMAPEQARGEHVDHRADIYALAALCYAMLTGRPPFGTRTLNDVLNRAADSKPEPLAGRFDAPQQLDSLLAAGLSADPGRRPPSASLLGDTLDRIADEVVARQAEAGTQGGSTESAEAGFGDIYAGGYDGLATMIRPSGVVVPTPDQVGAAGPAVDPGTDTGRLAEPEAEPDASEAEPDTGEAEREVPGAEPDAPEADPEPLPDDLAGADGKGESEADDEDDGPGENAPTVEAATDPGTVDRGADADFLPRPIGTYALLTAAGLAVFSVLVLIAVYLLR